MAEMTPKARRINLECDHVLWLKPPLPWIGQELWCPRCVDYRTVGPGHARVAPTTHPEYSWKSYPIPRGMRGECLITGCDFQIIIRGFYQLRDRMESHHLHTHADSLLISHAQFVPIPQSELSTEPPF